MLLAFALLQSGVWFAVASASKLEGERERKSVSQAVSRRRKPVPSAEGCFCENTPSFWQCLHFRGVLVLWERAAGLGFRLLGKKHLLILFVLLKTQLCEESRAAGGGRGRGHPRSQHEASPASSCAWGCCPSRGAAPALPHPGGPPYFSAPTLFFSGMHYSSKQQPLEWAGGWLHSSSAVGFGGGGVNVPAC